MIDKWLWMSSGGSYIYSLYHLIYISILEYLYMYPYLNK